MRRSLCIFFALALSLGVYLNSWGQAGLAPTDLEKLVAEEAGFILKSLDTVKNLDKDKKAQRKMRLAALMIAQFAQTAMAKDNPKNVNLATLRDQALAVRKAIEDGKFDEVKTMASKLSVNIPADANAKLAPVDLLKLEEFEYIMSQFSTSRLGGFGLEDALDNICEMKDNPAAAEAQKIDLYGKKVSMIAALAHGHTPPMLGGAKTLQAWQAFAKTMRQDALDLSKAAASMKASEISKAGLKLTDACKSCHDVFR